PTRAAPKQTRQQVSRSTLLIWMRSAARVLPALRLREEGSRHDREVRYLHRLPLALRIWTREPLAGIRILHHAELVPNKPSRIEFVVQDSNAALLIPVDGGGIPGPSAWRRHTVLIQITGDVARRAASNVFLEYTLDDFRLSLDNHPLTP